MSSAAPAIYAASSLGTELRQGEIITGLVEVRLNLESAKQGKETRIDEITHPYAIIVTQDCDLEQDHRARAKEGVASDKLLPCVLLMPMAEWEKFKGSLALGTKERKAITNNKNERYHVFEQVPKEADAYSAGLPALAVDFKLWLSVPTDELYWRVQNGARRRCRLEPSYLEHFSCRVGYFTSRVALPRDHAITD